ncbi:SDR family oxidoreductase [Mastigocoleus testarum]|uniref:dTDP-4-dehydrorhamnose reductase n=1 Tax=Mastigocoleus testarum BC008 TaxID=371196 RepID=A0A0V7ZT10_9CYAN|nr:NAD(P)-dependent oxidoreductase [Mastigocoleus testarum]KST67689.1 NAD(P)-dependent oxidoreductase [Mastigocoleus testarum BC008]
MSKKLLITGASGFLGWYLCQIARKEYSIYGTYLSHQIEIPGTKTLKVDLTDENQLKQVFQDIQPTAVIHTAALSQPNFCQTHPQESYKINVIASKNIAELCAGASISCIFTSTDLVFDGKNAPYKETDPVNPVNTYGEQKVMAEEEMLKCYPMTAVCRMPLMFGAATPTAKSFIQGFIETLQQRKELNLFTDEFRTPVSALTAAQGILLVLDKQINGSIHLGGRERISRYEFGKLMVKIFQLANGKIKPGRQQDVKMAAPRPSDVSLDSSVAFELGYSPFSVKEELEMSVSPFPREMQH